VLDLRDPTFWTDPHEQLRSAREHGRTALTQTGEHVLLRADDVELAHVDPSFANLGLGSLERLGISDGPFYAWRSHTLNVLEGEDHTRLRSFIGRAFTPRRTGKLRNEIRAHALALLDGASLRGELDVVADYATPLPLWAICRFLGIPDEDRHAIGDFLTGTEEGFTEAMTPEIRARAERSIVALYAHVERLVEQRRVQPRDDALSELVSSWVEGSSVSRDEFYALVVNLIGGAVGSTRAAISNSVYLLLRHPEQARRLRAAPEKLRGAIEECLRFFPPFRVGRRAVRSAVKAFDLELEAGDTLFIWRAAANRDPRRFERPDAFDIDRPPRPHISFGHGAHFCLGQALARVEVQEAVHALIGRFPEAELGLIEPQRVPFTMDERIVALPVRLGPDARI
jgi:cytochrome P450